MQQTVSILGATGSIGQSTLAVLRQYSNQYTVTALTAQNNWEKLAQIAQEFTPKYVAIGNKKHAKDLENALSGTSVKVAAGEEALLEAATMPCDTLMLSVVGIAGLKPALAAAQSGQRILLANKESLVCGGPFLMDIAQQNGAQIIPVDSEHNAILQIYDQPQNITEVTLTASGGPFLDWPKEKIARAKPAQAVAHPNWSMGAKISVDSATLMNKGLELIEAARFFPQAQNNLSVLIHPQSIIHGMVTFKDGTTKAVLSPPNMQNPIAVALGWPNERFKLDLPPLDLATIGKLTFKEPDVSAFPCLQLAQNALKAGLGACITLNTSNEIAVADFLAEKIPFYGIAKKVEAALTKYGQQKIDSVDDIFALNQEIQGD